MGHCLVLDLLIATVVVVVVSDGRSLVIGVAAPSTVAPVLAFGAGLHDCTCDKSTLLALATVVAALISLLKILLGWLFLLLDFCPVSVHFCAKILFIIALRFANLN